MENVGKSIMLGMADLLYRDNCPRDVGLKDIDISKCDPGINSCFDCWLDAINKFYDENNEKGNV